MNAVKSEFLLLLQSGQMKTRARRFPECPEWQYIFFPDQQVLNILIRLEQQCSCPGPLKKLLAVCLLSDRYRRRNLSDSPGFWKLYLTMVVI